jgi:predicted CXXCH cytochrome family protein
MLRLLLILLLPLLAQAGEKPTFVTSPACADCHTDAYQAWRDSHHGWAWREPSPGNVLGDFADASFTHHGFTYRFHSEDGRYFITADNAKGEPERFEVRYTVGVTPLQQYLVETGKGHLQSLDVVWDTERRRWFHLYPDSDTSAGNGMHWGGRYKNWNARCAECHATDFRKHYDARADTYHSTQAEIGVGCEACHGPGQAHLAWASAPAEFDPASWLGVDAQGLVDTYQATDSASRINLCVACHARREPLGGDSPPPGAAFDQHYRLSLLRDGLYFADGQIHDEVYVYGSFLQSKMYDRGVQCGDCHDSHSGALHQQGNAVCTQCHNPQGNPRFPSLPRKSYDAATHHFHEPGSAGAACVSCHMPERNYMVVDPRRDHSFRVPRPDLAVTLGTPEPCTGCHQDRDAQWAADEVLARFPAGRSGQAHFAQLFAAADRGDATAAAALIRLADDPTQPAILRASALDRLGRLSGQLEAQQVRRWLNDANPWVRTAAIGLATRVPGDGRMALLQPLLSDPVRSVRIQAVKRFLDVPADTLDSATRAALRTAMAELQRSLAARADFPEIQMVIGGVALTLRNLPAASGAFQRAVEMDPQLVDAWLMLARIHAATGDLEKVRSILEKGVANNPDDPVLQQALSELN